MEISKKGVVEYGGKEALATLVAEYGGELTEEEAKAKIDAALAGPPRGRRRVQQAIRNLNMSLSVIPSAMRRDVILRAAKRLRDRDARRAARRQFPALRNSRMLRIASWFFHDDKLESIFVPIASDYFLEYQQAQAEGRFKALLVMVRHWYGFSCAMGLDTALAWFDRIMKVLLMLMKWWF